MDCYHVSYRDTLTICTHLICSFKILCFNAKGEVSRKIYVYFLGIFRYKALKILNDIGLKSNFYKHIRMVLIFQGTFQKLRTFAPDEVSQ